MNNDDIYREIFSSELSKKEKKRLSIIEATIDCLDEGGLPNFSFNSIGKKLNIERSLVAHYFPKKEELLLATVMYVYAQGQRITVKNVEKKKTPLGKVLAIYDSAQEWLESDSRFPSIVTIFYSLTTVDPKFMAIHEEIQSSGLERLTMLLDLYLTSEGVDKSNLKIIAQSVHSLMLGMTLKAYTTKNNPQRSLRKVLKATIEELTS